MAVLATDRNFSPTLDMARRWIETCLINDGSVFSTDALWTAPLLEESREAFVGHPDSGKDDFITKLKGQMKNASPSAQKLMAEILWALLLFPSRMRPDLKRQ